MEMKIKITALLLSLVFISSSCKKEVDTITVEGFIKDEVSAEPVNGIQIFVAAIEPSSSGMGTIGGRRENVGQGITASRGYYKIKLKVFKNTERLNFDINAARLKEGYVYRQQGVYTTTLNKQGNNSLDFTLSAIALLKIKFKNTVPNSNADLFNFSYTSIGNGWYKGILKKESCGTVEVNESADWIGKDVCVEYIVEAMAEKTTQVYWHVLKNSVNSLNIDSIYIKRGVLNEFSI